MFTPSADNLLVILLCGCKRLVLARNGSVFPRSKKWILFSAGLPENIIYLFR
jgi:hypothetical protein